LSGTNFVAEKYVEIMATSRILGKSGVDVADFLEKRKSFSKASPSASWVLLHAKELSSVALPF
jgi:hypothetical protein